MLGVRKGPSKKGTVCICRNISSLICRLLLMAGDDSAPALVEGDLKEAGRFAGAPGRCVLIHDLLIGLICLQAQSVNATCVAVAAIRRR